MATLYDVKQLDKKIKQYKTVPTVPYQGWVKTIRETLGMTYVQLAKRLGISFRRVKTIEEAEASGKLKLETLARVADHLDCDLRYVLVPRNPNGFEGQVTQQARKKAQATLNASHAHMTLEDQSAHHAIKEQVEFMVQESLHAKSLKELWNE